MKKIIRIIVCLVFIFSLAGCGTKYTNDETEMEKVGDAIVKIEDVVCHNTNKAIAVGPEKCVIVEEGLPLEGSTSGKKVSAYAFISKEQLGDILVCLIDGEWYQFIETERAGLN